jgi:glycosyltransferase involved in cell wall biosynthesis
MSLPLLPLGLSIIVPVYNSQQTLPELVNRLHAVFKELSRPYEIIFINDGSHDRSWDVVVQLAASDERIHGINLMRNSGQHNALLCGIRQANYSIIVTIDDDLQNPPEEIPCMLAKLEEGYDVVYGTLQEEKHNLWRAVASRLTKYVLQSAMGVETARNVSSFRVFYTMLRSAFANYQSVYVSIDVLLTWGTTNFGAIPVKHYERRYGISNYTFRKLVVHALNMMTGFTIWPLQLASFLGFMFTGFGLLIFAYVIFSYLIIGSSVQGFAFLASVISIFSGVQLFALGIIGEYLARMHSRTMERPAYSIRNTTNEVTIRV